MDESRRFFLKSLIGSSVAYCFLSSVPLLGTETSDVHSIGPLMRGDVITIAGVYSLNPITLKETGRLQQFVVTQDTAGGVISIAPQIISSGPKRTVSTSKAGHKLIAEPWGSSWKEWQEKNP